MRGLLLRERETTAHELMDDPGCDLVALRRTYAHFPVVNRWVSGWRGVYVRTVRPLLSRASVTTLLDVGCGGGDVARSLARWARHDGLALEVTGVDPDVRAWEYATSLPAQDGVRFERCTSGELVAAGRRFDVVTSNHVLHHLDPGALDALLEDSRRLARRLVVHNDIRRSPLAWAGYAVGTLPFVRWGRPHATFIRDDGLLSVRRSYTAGELAGLAPAGWQVRTRAPFRLLLVDEREPAGVPAGTEGPGA